MSDATLAAYAYLAEAEVEGVVVDLLPPSAYATSELLAGQSTTVATVSSDRKSAPTVCADPAALPFESGAVDAVLGAGHD